MNSKRQTARGGSVSARLDGGNVKGSTGMRPDSAIRKIVPLEDMPYSFGFQERETDRGASARLAMAMATLPSRARHAVDSANGCVLANSARCSPWPA